MISPNPALQISDRAVYRLESLREIGLELTTQLDLNTLLRSVVEKAISLVDGEAGGLYLYHPDRDVLEWSIAVGNGVAPLGTILHKGEGVSGTVLNTHQSIAIDNYAQWPYQAHIYVGYEWHAVMAVPIYWRQTLLGVLNVLASQPFSTDDVTIMELFATQVATAIHNANLFEAEREQRLLAETLADITLLLASHTDIEALLREVLVQAHHLVPSKTSNVMFVEGSNLRVAQWRGYEAYGMGDYMTGLVQRLADLPPDQEAVTSGQTLLIQDTHTHPDWVVLPESSWIRSYLSIPIMRQGRAVGVLRLDGEKVGEFDETDVKKLRPLANAAAIALDNAQLFHKTQEQNRELRTLHHISEIFQSHLSLEQAIQQVAEAVNQATHFPIIAIELYNPEHQQMTIKGLVGFTGMTGLPDITLPSHETLANIAIQQQKPFIGLQVHKRPEYVHSMLRFLQVKTFLGIPLRAGQRILGVLCLASAEEWQTDDEFIHWLVNLADYVGSLIDYKRVEEGMRHTQKLESLGVMAGGIAHDFNNLLAGLMMQNTIVQHKLGEATPVRENLRQIMQITHRAAELTRQLLAYAGRMEPQVELVDLNQLVQDNEHFLHTSIPRSITLKMTLAPHLPPIQADPGQIQQVIMNLIINAAESYEGQAGTVSVSTYLEEVSQNQSTSHLWNQALPAGHYICLVVQDYGKGMAEATQRRIFEPFFTTKLTGRGLGLAAVLGIVRSHGGDIKVNSQLRIGTTFQVWLPAVTAAAALTPNRQPSSLPPPPPLSDQGSVLIIDDEDVLRQALDEILGTLGLNCLLAENGQIGLELFEKHRHEISLILLDMTMPVMSGQDVLKYLRRIQAPTPIILSSGYHEDSNLITYDNLQIVGFLHKPFHLDDLLSLVRRTLEIPG